MTERLTDEQLDELEKELNDLLNTPEREIKHPVPVQRAAGLGLTVMESLRDARAQIAQQQVELEDYRDAVRRWESKIDAAIDATRARIAQQQAELEAARVLISAMRDPQSSLITLREAAQAYDAARAGEDGEK